MIWNPFKPNTPQSSLQSPTELSGLINTVATLFLNKQFPFSEWEDKRISITDDERLFFTRVCLTAQLSSFAQAIELTTNDPLTSELCMHSILKKIAPDFDDYIASSVFFRYYTIQNKLVNDIVEMKLNDLSIGDGDPQELISIKWVAAENNYNNRSFGADTAFKLSVNLKFAVSNAAELFGRMRKRINIIDIENVTPIHFRDERALFEEIIYRQYRYPEIFELRNNVNARDVITARRVEDERFSNSRDELMSLNNALKEILKRDPKTEETYNAVREWFFKVDDCRMGCYAIGGKLREILLALDYLRESTFESLENSAAEQEVSSRYEYLHNVCDNSYLDLMKSRMLLRIRASETKEVVPFILSSSEDDIVEYINNVDKDGEMSRNLVGFALEMIEKLKTRAERETVEKIRFLGKRVELLMGVARE